MKILIAEDVEDSRVMLAMALEGYGDQVISCSNGLEALHQVHQQRPDLIISDILMPEMDGFEFCRQVKGDDGLKDIPFIFYTATYTDSSDEELALALGADRFVIKPVEMETLYSIVTDVMEELRESEQEMDDDPTLVSDRMLDHMHLKSLTRKLDKKIHELESEREALKNSEQKYRQLVESIQDYYFFYSRNLQGSVTYLSPSFTTILGYPIEHAINNCDQLLTSHSSNAEFRKSTELTLQGQIQPAIQCQVKHFDGSKRWLEIKEAPIHDASGKLNGLEGIAHDITDNKLAKDKLVKLQRAVEASSSAVIITDHQGVVDFVNHRFCELTEFSKDEVLGKDYRALKLKLSTGPAYKDMQQTIDSGRDWSGEIRNLKKDGSLYRSHTSISPVKNVHGEITHFIEIQDDLTSHYELTEKLSYQASHDALTGLFNRHEFERRSERALFSSQQDEGVHALCFLDLDQFKIVNDVAGHVAGDELLRQVSRMLQGIVRQSDTLARIGGDEFGILMQYCSLNEAQKEAETVLQKIQEFQYTWEDREFRLGASIGLVGMTKDIPNLTELLKLADAACYMAKDLGRNRIHVYQSEDLKLAQRQGDIQWVSRIHRALENNRFVLYAQPIAPMECNERLHYELLLRMLDDDGKIIPPGAFLTAAERYNMMQPIDAWVIKNAFKLLADCSEFVDSIDLVSINLSGPSLANTDFLNYILELMQSTGVNPEKLCFEITETVAISNLSAAIHFITTLRSEGCSFSLDDFGSGLSSFGYLKTLPVDFLKIDGMFVKDILEDDIDLAMVKSINDIGQVMGMQTIAEFVESDAIRNKLKVIGVDFVQGYAIGKPQPLEELVNDC